jgi:CRP-like cAMP-binding protein
MDVPVALASFIRANTPHVAVQDDALAHISGVFAEWPLQKGEYLLKQGKQSGYYILLDGHMRAYTFSGQGEAVTTAFFSGPEVVLEVASFYQQTPSEETIVALSECQGYYTTFEKLNALFHHVPEFREFGRAVLVQGYVAHKQRTLAMVNKSAQERYERLIETNRGVVQVAQLRHIASYLGVTDSSLSRIRKVIARR